MNENTESETSNLKMTTPKPGAETLTSSDAGARDIAQRDLDMAGFRIFNMGEPEEEGSFTSVDLRATPKRASGSGLPGKSLLAAAADHVHPAGEGGEGSAAEVLEAGDGTQQAVTGTDEHVVAEFLVGFEIISSKTMTAALEAVVKAEGGDAIFALRLGGAPGEPDGEKLLEFSTKGRDFEIAGKSGDDVEVPSRADIVKVTARSARKDGVAHIRAKKVRFAAEPE